MNFIILLLKNLKVIFRNYYTIVIFIVFPILLMSVIGFTYGSNNLNEIKIGIIEGDSSFFKINTINFSSYNLNDTQSSTQACIKDLNLSNVHLCIKLNLITQEEQVIGADIIYYTDNSRLQMTEILINFFEEYIKRQTDTISSKRVDQLYLEVNESAIFLIELKTIAREFKDELLKLNSSVFELEKKIR